MLAIAMQQAQGAPQGDIFTSLVLPVLGMGLIFYFLLIRPQNKRMKEHREMLASVTRGDTIVTSGGLIGKVTKVGDGELTVDLGNNHKVKVVSTMIANVRRPNAANENKSAKK